MCIMCTIGQEVTVGDKHNKHDVFIFLENRYAPFIFKLKGLVLYVKSSNVLWGRVEFSLH